MDLFILFLVCSVSKSYKLGITSHPTLIVSHAKRDSSFSVTHKTYECPLTAVNSL